MSGLTGTLEAHTASRPRSLAESCGSDITCKGSGKNYYTACKCAAPFSVPSGVAVFRITRPMNGLWFGTVTFTAA